MTKPKSTTRSRASKAPSAPAASPAALFADSLAKLGELVYERIFAAGMKAIADIEKAAASARGARQPSKAKLKVKAPRKVRQAAPPPPPAKGASKRTPEAIARVGDVVLALLEARPWLTLEQIAAETKISTRDLKTPLAKLKGRRALRWRGQKRATVYALTAETSEPPMRAGAATEPPGAPVPEPDSQPEATEPEAAE